MLFSTFPNSTRCAVFAWRPVEIQLLMRSVNIRLLRLLTSWVKNSCISNMCFAPSSSHSGAVAGVDAVPSVNVTTP